MSSEHKILARIPISVRWRDMDSMGHVNNAKYISYLEEARVRWMLGVDGVSMTDRIAPVVAATNVNYRLPIVWPNDIVVELFVERLAFLQRALALHQHQVQATGLELGARARRQRHALDRTHAADPIDNRGPVQRHVAETTAGRAGDHYRPAAAVVDHAIAGSHRHRRIRWQPRPALLHRDAA